MGTELGVLTLYGLLVVIVTVVQVLAANGQVGLQMLASARDDMPKLEAVAGRLERALNNCIIGMVLFAPAVLILQAKGISTSGTLLAAQIFLVARIAYVVTYAAGIAWVRTAIWGLGLIATLYLYFAGM